jgi:hypothetical protein
MNNEKIRAAEKSVQKGALMMKPMKVVLSAFFMVKSLLYWM